MITITTVVGAVGFGFGVCFATACLTLAALYDDYRNKKNIPKDMEYAEMDVVWSVDDDE